MPQTLEQRLWSRVEQQPDGCWLWRGTRQARRRHPRNELERGYGVIWFDHRYIGVHRLVYELLVGPVGTAFVCHHCDNPICVNPAHLFLGTHDDNMRDMARKGRACRAEANHKTKLTPQAVHEIRRRALAGESQRALARRFGVSKNAIANILHGKAWAHVQAPEGETTCSSQ